MYWEILFFLTLTCHSVVGLNQSDGYNIGVVLGSVLGALIVVGIAGFLFYMFCIRRWLGMGEPAELGYARQNNFNSKKQTGASAGKPSKFAYGVQGKAPVYAAGPPPAQTAVSREGGRRQGAANDMYQHDEPQIRPQYTSAVRYEGEMVTGPGVMLSASGSDHQLRHHSPNISSSSESEMRNVIGQGRQAYEVTTTRSYQQRGYTSHTAGGSAGEGGSPISAAYIGTGV